MHNLVLHFFLIIFFNPSNPLSPGAQFPLQAWDSRRCTLQESSTASTPQVKAKRGACARSSRPCSPQPSSPSPEPATTNTTGKVGASKLLREPLLFDRVFSSALVCTVELVRLKETNSFMHVRTPPHPPNICAGGAGDKCFGLVVGHNGF